MDTFGFRKKDRKKGEGRQRGEREAIQWVERREKLAPSFEQVHQSLSVTLYDLFFVVKVMLGESVFFTF